MEKSQLSPISGEHFEDFLLLTNPEHKSTQTKQAWQALQQQTQTHVPSIESVDLNRIFIDTIRLELLIFPVVEHWKRPLTKNEWNHIDKESMLLEKQMEKMRKLSILVRKKDPLAFPEIAPLFNKIFKHNKELRNNWDEFKRAWSNYKKDWQIFQTKKNLALKSKNKPSNLQSENKAQNSSNENDFEPPITPPMFLRDRWHALRLGSKALEVEVLHQCDRFRNVTRQKPKEINEATHPGVKFLVEELRKIYLKTHGFELIKRVKLVQERNSQLMKELQPYFPEPIISAKMRAETKIPSINRGITAVSSKKNNNPDENFWRKIILFLLLIFIGLFLIFLFQKQGTTPGESIWKHLKFVPKNKTLTAKSSTVSKLSEFNLEDMMQEFGSKIPLQESNERLKKIVTAPPEILENIANNILRQIGENTVFVFSEAKSFFLFWKGKVEKFASPQDLQKRLRKLDQQYKDIESLWKKIGSKAPETANLIPDFLDGEPTYALEMLDENGNPMQVYMTEEGVLLRLSNGQLLEKPLTPKEAFKKIADN